MNFHKPCLIALLISGAAAAPEISAAESPAVMTEITSGYIPTAAPGCIHRYSVRCNDLNDSYTVDVWLPDEYQTEADKQYPVVYMHDGQNLFDPAISFAGAAWEIDLALSKLSGLGIIHTPIIVGIHNRGTLRPADYIPEKPVMDYIAEADRNASGMWSLVGGTFNGDEYASFIANTLKPAVDALFRTKADCENTSVMGSSMGGLASIYAMCEYPDVFGAAACLSTHWIGNFDYANTIFPTAMLAYLADCLPDPATHRLYLDRGTVDLDSSYDTWETMARSLAQEKGYSEDAGNFLTFTDTGASHNEVYWAARVDRPLHFLLHSTDEPYTPTDPESLAMHVIFQDASRPWTKVNAFTWATGVLQIGSWPGSPMTQITYNGEPAWEIKFTHKLPPTNIIFNNGSAQTADLDFLNNYVYDFRGPKEPISTASVADAAEASAFSIRAAGRTLIVDTPDHRTLNVHTLDGRVFSFPLHPGTNTISTLSPGIYIAAGKKLFLR
ncbi:MAG: starch-binding protein [Muribaculaceae bacterium]|nr:starch-binding protein [Muribaculaceae bacterium]